MILDTGPTLSRMVPSHRIVGILLVIVSAAAFGTLAIFGRFAIDAGADDVRTEEETYEVFTAPEDFVGVRDAFTSAGITPQHAEVTMVPSTTVRVEGRDASQLLKMLDQLEDHDDVQNVYANFDIDEAVMASLG